MAEEIVFNINVDAGNSAESVNAVNTELTETEKLTEEVGKQGTKSMRDLGNESNKASTAIKKPTTRLRELTDAMAMMSDQGGPEFQELAREAGTLQDQINNARAATNAMSNDFPGLQVGVQAMQGIGAAAQGATAAQALLGSENEDIAKSIQKMMAIQALMNSVQQIANVLSDESALGLKLRAIQTRLLTSATNMQTGATVAQTVQQKILNFVMNKNPVFLLITGFLALAAGVAAFASSTKDARTQQELLNEAQDESLDSIGAETAKLDDLTDVLKSETASRSQKREAIEELNKSYPEFLGNIDLETASQEELNVAIGKQTELITLQAEAKALASIKADLFKEKLELEMEATREATGAWSVFTDAIGAGTAARLHDDLANQARQGTILEEIEAVDASTEANRNNTASLLEGAEAKKTLNTLADALTKQQEAAAKNVDASSKKAEADRKKRAAERAKLDADEASNAIARAKLMEDILIANNADADMRKIMALKKSHERERASTVEKYGEDTALILELEKKQAAEVKAVHDEIALRKADDNREAVEAAAELAFTDNNARLEAELLALDEDDAAIYEKKQELLLLNRERDLADAEITNGEKLLVEQKFIDDTQALKDEAEAADDARRKIAIDKTVAAFDGGVQAISDLSETVFAIKSMMHKKGSKEDLKAAKAQFQVNKAMQLSAAVSDGYKAVQASLAASPLTVLGVPNPAAIAALAFTGISAAKNIAKIAASKFQGGGSGGASISAPSLPSSSAAEPQGPDNDPFGTSTLTDGLDGSGTQQPSGQSGRVVLVDSDVKASQDNIKRVGVTSSIG